MKTSPCQVPPLQFNLLRAVVSHTMLPYSELHIFPLVSGICALFVVSRQFCPPPKFKKLAPPLLRSSPTPSTKQRPLVDSSLLTVQCSRWHFVTLTRYKTTVTQLLFWSYLFFSSVGEMFFHQLPWVPLTKWWMMTFNKKTKKQKLRRANSVYFLPLKFFFFLPRYSEINATVLQLKTDFRWS